MLIMKTPTYSPLTLERLLQQNEIATFDELKSVLGNPARATVFRKLAELDYLSSYSHRGRYYTMRSIARFSAVGLWSCRAVWFSRYGNLLDTAQALVEQSAAGYSALELKTIVQVKTKHALKDLTDRGRLQREKIGAQYIYLAADDQAAQQQRRTRESDEPSLATVLVINPDLATEEAKATILLFCSLLDEKQRRLYAGLESLKLGYGGDAHIGALLGMDPHTVARGRRELVRGDFSSDGVRAKGGGRLPQEKKHRIS
jgi:hypothetical protein